MFKLENTISAWRNELFRAGLSPAAVFELESHLRDDIARQIESGVAAETAFHAAARSLGGAATLRPEFQKTRRPSLLPLWPGICLSLFTAFVIALNVYVGEVAREFGLIYCLLFSLGMVIYYHQFSAEKGTPKPGLESMLVRQILLGLFAVVIVFSPGQPTFALTLAPVAACVLIALRLFQKRREAARRIAGAE